MTSSVTMKSLAAVSVLAVTLAFGSAIAAGSQQGGSADTRIGTPGKASEASRSVAVVLHDTYFEPERISVAEAETIRLTIRNDGKLVHEFSIGTPALHMAHQEEILMMVEHGVIAGSKIDRKMMKMDMGGGHTMEYKHPNGVLLEPGASAEIIWKFATPTQMEFACGLPGHYDAGMLGAIEFASK
jgi:uncharacterized cupredoxin-like copper-binding protein